jgi:hypothetical protein
MQELPWWAGRVSLDPHKKELHLCMKYSCLSIPMGHWFQNPLQIPKPTATPVLSMKWQCLQEPVQSMHTLLYTLNYLRLLIIPKTMCAMWIILYCLHCIHQENAYMFRTVYLNIFDPWLVGSSDAELAMTGITVY